MQRVLTAVLLAATVAAQTPDESAAAIRSVIKEFNKDRAMGRDSAANHLMRNADFWNGTGDVRPLAVQREVMTEMTAPQIRHETVRLLSPDVAVVDAYEIQYGSLPTIRRQPVTLLMQREGGEWKIASLRVLGGCQWDSSLNVPSDRR